MTQTRLIWLTSCISALSVLNTGISAADERLAGCPDSRQKQPAAIRSNDDRQQPDGSSLIEIQADRVELNPDNTTTFSGHVELQQSGQKILANEINYHKQTDTINASGNIKIENPSGDTFTTNRLEFNTVSQTGKSGPAEFRLSGEGRGSAHVLDFRENGRLNMSRVKYTTCPPENESWHLSVNRLKIDNEKDIGVARHALIVFQHIPVFYWPYIDFPLSGQRKSGFLAPEIGHSDRSGNSLATPYYLNIAPNIDDTLSPRIFSERGTQLGNEFRYLAKTYSGTLDAEVLPDDKEFNDDRAAAHFQHKQALGNKWSATIDATWVSDDAYLDDFSDSLAAASQAHLPRQALLRYRGRSWRFDATAVSYQTIDNSLAASDIPYEVRPRLSLSTVVKETPGQADIDLESELVRFERDTSVIGTRLRLRPDISLPLQNRYSFFKPHVGTYYWTYDLSDTPAALRAADFEETADVSVPYVAFDTGLFFDRRFRLKDRAYIQSLEPRIFYVNTRFRNQDNLPDFDSGLPDFRYGQLFRINRFVGGDRVGDTNQITTALTTRIVDQELGEQRLSLTVGQIHYLQDRRVNLPSTTIVTDKSDIVAELDALLRSKVYWQANGRWDAQTREIKESQAYLQFNPNHKTIFNVGYIRALDGQEQSDVSFQFPVSNRWTLIGRQNYSITERHNLESNAGLGYRSCCWAFRLFASRRLTTTGEQTNSILFQLELTGLSSAGEIPDSPLKQSIFDDF